MVEEFRVGLEEQHATQLEGLEQQLDAARAELDGQASQTDVLRKEFVEAAASTDADHARELAALRAQHEQALASERGKTEAAESQAAELEQRAEAAAAAATPPPGRLALCWGGGCGATPAQPDSAQEAEG